MSSTFEEEWRVEHFAIVAHRMQERDDADRKIAAFWRRDTGSGRGKSNKIKRNDFPTCDKGNSAVFR